MVRRFYLTSGEIQRTFKGLEKDYTHVTDLVQKGQRKQSIMAGLSK